MLFLLLGDYKSPDVIGRTFFYGGFQIRRDAWRVYALGDAWRVYALGDAWRVSALGDTWVFWGFRPVLG